MTLVGLAARRLAQKRRSAKLASAFPNGIRCQKCLQMGHWSYECKEKPKYVHRNSRTKQLKKRLAEKTAAEAVKSIDDTCNQVANFKRSPSTSSSSSSSSSSTSSSSSSSNSSSSDSSDDDDSSSDDDSDSSSDSDSESDNDAP